MVKSIEIKYRKAVLRVIKDLTEEDLSMLKYLEGGETGLGRGELQKITKPLDYIKSLESRDLLSTTKLEHLKDTLKDIDAIAALQHIKNYEQENLKEIAALRKKRGETIPLKDTSDSANPKSPVKSKRTDEQILPTSQNQLQGETTALVVQSDLKPPPIENLTISDKKQQTSSDNSQNNASRIHPEEQQQTNSQSSEDDDENRRIAEEHAAQIDSQEWSGFDRNIRTAKVYIISNSNFSHLPQRSGNEKDIDSLRKGFGKTFGWDVELLEDLTKQEMHDFMKKLATDKDFTADALIVFILTHGNAQGIYGTDSVEKGPTGIHDYVNLFEPTMHEQPQCLHGVPKFLFIQSSRYDQFDFSLAKSISKKETISFVVDVMVVYSTLPGTSSWRNSASGSWFCSLFVQTLREFHEREDIIAILERTKFRVSRMRPHTRLAMNYSDDAVCQLPVYETGLRHRCFFNRTASPGK